MPAWWTVGDEGNVASREALHWLVSCRFRRIAAFCRCCGSCLKALPASCVHHAVCGQSVLDPSSSPSLAQADSDSGVSAEQAVLELLQVEEPAFTRGHSAPCP